MAGSNGRGGSIYLPAEGSGPGPSELRLLPVWLGCWKKDF